MKKTALRARIPSTHTTTVLALALAGSLAFPAAVHSTESAGAPVAIEITKFTFAPKEITVAPGTRVVWTNRDESPHTVSSNDKSFASKGLDTEDKFEHVFAQPGDFTYFCTVHPFMTGVVHVRK